MRLPPLAIALGSAALLVLLVGGLGLAFLLFRGAPGGTQEVVGSALPPGWRPGGGQGVGEAPPPPGGAPPPPSGTAPPVPEAVPYAGAPELAPGEDGLPPEETATPGFGEPPQGPVEGESAVPSFEPPHLVYLPTPEYPAIGQRLGKEGTVNLRVLVGANGRVLEAEPVGERLGMGFEASARRAAFNARFEPARRNGEPVDGEARIAIHFRLQ
jgi:protein TonB